MVKDGRNDDRGMDKLLAPTALAISIKYVFARRKGRLQCDKNFWNQTSAMIENRLSLCTYRQCQ